MFVSLVTHIHCVSVAKRRRVVGAHQEEEQLHGVGGQRHYVEGGESRGLHAQSRSRPPRLETRGKLHDNTHLATLKLGVGYTIIRI
jgi:hypothetical protein